MRQSESEMFQTEIVVIAIDFDKYFFFQKKALFFVKLTKTIKNFK